MRLPTHPGEITARQLGEVLRDVGLLATGSVESVRWQRFAADRGFTGVISRGFVRYANASSDRPAPAMVIAKFPMAERDVESTYSVGRRNDNARRRHFDRSVRELRFYREIAPVAGVPVPQLYAGAIDERALSVGLIMQDVRDAEYRDLLTGCTPSDADEVVSAIAPLHAWGFAHDGPDWLPSPEADYDAVVGRYAGYVEPFLAEWGAYLPAGVRDLVRRLTTRLHRVLTELDDARSTVIHGDLHLDNILFQRDGEDPVVILDWQAVRRGPVALDVGGFVVESLPPGTRRAHAERIYADYLSKLADYGITGMTLDRLLLDTRLVLLRRLAGIVNWAVRASSADVGPRERALIEAAVANDRLAAALFDYDAGELLR